MKNPCRRDCPDRTGTCHDTCERYIEWRDSERAAKRALAKEKEEGVAVHNSIKHRIKQMKKGRGK